MRKCRHISVTISLTASSLPPAPSFLLPSTPPSCLFYASLARHLFIRPSLFLSAPLPLSFSLSFFFHSLLVFCALPVSQRIPLVAQLRDSAGKLRLFKARSAGKASSCWKEAAWTWRTSPHVYTLAHINTDTHTSHSAQPFYYYVSLHFKPERCHSM